jgi:DNA-binding MarR family transcriptional regulator
LDRARRRSKGAGALALLQALEGHDGVRPSAIAAAVQVHPSFATRQVQELEESGYVLVTADDGDRRSCLVALTEQGHAELERLRRIGLERFALFVNDWDTSEVRDLTRLLEKLEASKAAAAASERPPVGTRTWRRQR